MSLYRALRPLLFRMDAEQAHRATIAMLKRLPPLPRQSFPASLATTVGGVTFPSPVGLAAGFDKDAEVADAMLGLGFGFVEVGTLTPKPQGGNPRPRLFRLLEDGAVINRMGFNNHGQEAALNRLAKRDRSRGVVGVNIGANKDSADRVGDYAYGVSTVIGAADYLTVNISSPNTPGLRNLQDGGELVELLAAVRDARGDHATPVFLKVAPDLGNGDHERIARAARDHRIDALIVANTTITRPPLRSRLAAEQGGLSGAPLKALALEQLRRFRAVVGDDLPLIAAGGIASADDAWDRIVAGASLVQLYSALVYEGPGLARRIAHGLAARLAAEGMASIKDAVGSATR